MKKGMKIRFKKGEIKAGSNIKTREVRDELAVLIFLGASYLSIGMFGDYLALNILGIFFFISGLWGIVSISKGARFVFG